MMAGASSAATTLAKATVVKKNAKGAKAMKPSGVEWLGDIPEGWKVRRLKDAFSYGKGLSITKADLIPMGVPVISYGQIHSKDNSGTHLQDALLRHVPESYLETDSDCLLKENDFVFADTSEDLDGLGNCAFVDRNDRIFAGYHTIVFRPKINVYFRYLAYLFKTDVWRGQFRAKAFGIKVYSLSQRLLNGCSIVLPPLPEQRAIADYLDAKCGAIDAAIAEAKKGIEEYKAWKKSLIFEVVTGKKRVCVFNAEKQSSREAEKMKPSGIPWIGEIPEGWAMIKASKIFSVITDFVASGSFADLRDNVKYLDYPDYAQLIRTADVSGKAHELSAVYIGKESYDFLSGSNLYGGELLLPNIGASVGDVYIVPKLYERMSLAPNAIMVKNSPCDKFYFYFFSCDSGRLALEDIAESTAQPKFNKTDFRNLRLPTPPLPEQQAIADYLDEKCAAIDAMIAEKEALIADLEAYKKSLIYEVVTGKEPRAAALGTEPAASGTAQTASGTGQGVA